MTSSDLSELSAALPSAKQALLHVEVRQKSCSTAAASGLEPHIAAFLTRVGTVYGETCLKEFDDPVLRDHVQSISLCDIAANARAFWDFSKSQVQIHIYQVNENGPVSEELDTEEDITASQHWLLPNIELEGSWESLVYDNEIKHKLLNYAETALLFSDKGVDDKIVTWNRVVLLHGPPGTGKTSLCKALAHKLSIRLAPRFQYGLLVEINSHSLFSKWFSESGKLVQKMFGKITDLISDRDALVCVLMDEVESLTSARKSAMSGSEPSDAIRVVNALLTQIDQIKRYPNVLILTTSNVTGAIDLAFVDRADIKQYIGLPSQAAIYKIYQSCIRELARVGIIRTTNQILDFRSLEVMRFVSNDVTQLSLRLNNIAQSSEGLSGRTLRKMPFLAHACHRKENDSLSLETFLDALNNAVKAQFKDRDELSKENL